MTYAVWYFFLIGVLVHPFALYVLFRYYRVFKQ